MSFINPQPINSNSVSLDEVNQQPLLAPPKYRQFIRFLGTCVRKVFGYITSVEIGAAVIGAAGALAAAYGVFLITQYYQDNDSRQRALNDYVNSMKELIASTGIERDNPHTLAALQRSRTLLIMRELGEDGDRKGQVLRFLHETCLFKTGEGTKRCAQSLLEGGQQEAIENTVTANLSGINLDNVVLQDVWAPNMNLSGVYMRGANLQESALSGSEFVRATLTASNFQNSTLAWTVFEGADLTAVNFSSAQMYRASFVGSNLTEADLRGADLRFANLAYTNLSDASDLTGVCYVEGTETRYFPPGFDPNAFGMVAIPATESNPNDSANFKSCPPVSLPQL